MQSAPLLLLPHGWGRAYLTCKFGKYNPRETVNFTSSLGNELLTSCSSWETSQYCLSLGGKVGLIMEYDDQAYLLFSLKYIFYQEYKNDIWPLSDNLSKLLICSSPAKQTNKKPHHFSFRPGHPLRNKSQGTKFREQNITKYKPYIGFWRATSLGMKKQHALIWRFPFMQLDFTCCSLDGSLSASYRIFYKGTFGCWPMGRYR